MASDKSDYGMVVFLLTMVALALIAAGIGGSAIGLHYERQKAIEAGVGRWVVNGATGKTEFKYGVSN